MSQPHRIALVGFSSFEKVTFESFFRLAARRPPGYVLVEDTGQADLAVINADDVAVLRQCIATKPSRHVLLIGNQDGGTGWTLQKRPLNLMKVLATVESLLSPAGVPAQVVASAPSTAPAVVSTRVPAHAAAPTRPTFAATEPSALGLHKVQAAPVVNKSAPTAQAMQSVRTGSGKADFDHSRADSIAGLTQPSTLETGADVDHILVVDDSDIALKFMRNRLSRFGFHADLVNSGEEALGRLSTKSYKFVFLDVMMEGLDGYQTCRAIKQRKYADGKPPVVVMLTSRGGTIDKIRGTLAGCDAYLTKPLNERDLIAVLAKHDRSVARGFQETNFGVNSKSSLNSKM
jgi:two-component system, cell cycle response regulator